MYLKTSEAQTLYHYVTIDPWQSYRSGYCFPTNHFLCQSSSKLVSGEQQVVVSRFRGLSLSLFVLTYL